MIGTRIKIVRDHFKLSQQELADKLLLNKTSISLFENNKREPGVRTIRDLCDLYSLNEDWLKTGEGNMFCKEGEYNLLLNEVINKLDSDDPDKLIAIKKMLSLSLEEIKSIISVMDQFILLKEKR